MDKEQKERPFSEEEKQKLLQLSEISILLNSYEDIFSDFDPRPFSERAISDDFLLEAKKAAKEKKGGTIELKLMIPSQRKNPEIERIIKRRLRNYFREHYEKSKKEVKEIMKKGALFLLSGILLMLMATYFWTRGVENFGINLLSMIAEPGGWFFFWAGLDKFIYEVATKKPDLEFYEKMSRCAITFLPY